MITSVLRTLLERLPRYRQMVCSDIAAELLHNVYVDSEPAADGKWIKVAELEAALATLPPQEQSVDVWMADLQLGGMNGYAYTDMVREWLTKKLAALPPAPPQETKMPWSAHRSHAMQDHGCVRCGTVAREFAITFKCPYDSPVAAPPREQESEAACVACEVKDASGSDYGRVHTCRSREDYVSDRLANKP